MKTATLHVKINPSLAEKLKKVARQRETPVGELVRQAVSNSFQLEFMQLPDKQRRALYAYQGGYISIGKLAEEMGMHVLALRKWLSEHDVVQNAAYSGQDADNA